MASSIETNVTPSVIPDAHTYYNNPQEHGLKQRDESKILYLRNFNNWIKSTLINEYLQRIKKENPERSDKIHVFDMGCGKGGDQPKWQASRVNSVTFADIAENSIEVCRQRYYDRTCHYKAEFFALDCTKALLRDKMKTIEPCFDLVSTQFVLHYSFDQFKSANQFLRNAAELLRIGGYFIGTTINSCELIERCRESSEQHITNDVFSFTFDSAIDLNKTSNESIPLFGAKYHFKLDNVVDCPEYLVYFPLLEKLAAKHGLRKVDRKTFKEFFVMNKDNGEGRFLLSKIKALEYYELQSNSQRGPSIDHSQYTHAVEYINEANKTRSNPIRCCRTLSKQEWDMTSLYITFAFEKVRHVKYDDDEISNQ